MKLDYCYHCHTYRCGHAFGKDEDYVLQAIKLGIKRLGFSDHAFLPEGYSQPGIRGDYNLLSDYIKCIKELKEKYKDQIEIHIGLEAEYFPEMVDYYKDLLSKDIEYLILGQHCFLSGHKFFWYFPFSYPIGYLKHYATDVIKGLKTGLFSYLAHPDLFMLGHNIWNEESEYYSRKILKTCEELGIPIEVNATALRRGKSDGYYFGYPNLHFFELAKEYKVKYVLGIDAHAPEDFSEESLNKMFDFVKRAGITFEENYRIDLKGKNHD